MDIFDTKKSSEIDSEDFLLIYRPNTTDNIFQENLLDSLSIHNGKCSDKKYHGFLRELIWTEFDINIPKLLLVVMVSEYTIYYSSYILCIIIDSYFDFITSCENRINNKSLRKFFLEIEFKNIDSFLEFNPEISLKSHSGSRWLFLRFVVAECVLDHNKCLSWWNYESIIYKNSNYWNKSVREGTKNSYLLW